MIVALKYRRERRLAHWVGDQLVPLVPALIDAITWVPATPERVRWRGYDQSQEIATHVARSLGVPCERLLGRTSRDQRQTSRTRHERAQGPQLFARAPADGLVAVIDDVVTTGATVATAQAVLRSSGSALVVPVVLAATPKDMT